MLKEEKKKKNVVVVETFWQIITLLDVDDYLKVKLQNDTFLHVVWLRNEIDFY